MSRRTDAGHATLELALTATTVTLVLAGAAWLVRAEWKRGQCAYVVFERTHARLTGRPPLARASVAVRLAEDDGGVTGEADCGEARERVRLPKLEN
jgi:hypothetical protein